MKQIKHFRKKNWQMKSNQCRMKESEFENTDIYWSYLSKFIIIGIIIIIKVVYNHDLQSRAYRDTAQSKGGTYSMHWKYHQTMVNGHAWHEHILRSVNAMYPIQQQKSYLLGCNPFDKYIVIVSIPPVPVVEQNRIWGQSEQSSTGATISSPCKTNHVWLQ